MNTAQPSASAALAEARKRVGGSAGLARAISERGGKITSQAISQWDRVPAERVLEVETVTGIPRHELRPDIYPRAREASAPGAAA